MNRGSTVTGARVSNDSRTYRVADGTQFRAGDQWGLDAETTSSDLGRLNMRVASITFVSVTAGLMDLTIAGGSCSANADSTDVARNGAPTKTHAYGATLEVVMATDIGSAGTANPVHPGNTVQVNDAAAPNGVSVKTKVIGGTAIKTRPNAFMTTLMAA